MAVQAHALRALLKPAAVESTLEFVKYGARWIQDQVQQRIVKMEQKLARMEPW
jgi:hypothetical protein